MAMKLVTGIVTSLVIGSLSFGVFAAKELEKDKLAGMNLTKIGEIQRLTPPRQWTREESCRKRRMSWAVRTTS
jgi:hypothetical protein